MKQLYITLILLLLHLCTSCDDQRLFDDSPHEEGYTYISFNVRKNLLVETTTRATAEDIFNKTGIRDLHLLVFDKNKKFKSCEKVDITTMQHSIALARCTFKTLIEIKVDDVIVMLANTGINQTPDNITFDNMNEKFMPVKWKITDETEKEIDKDLPMHGIIDAWKGNNAGQVLSLKKSVTKLNFYVNNIPNSTGNVKWMVAHVPLTGVIFHDEKKLTIEASPNLTDDSFYMPTKEGQHLDLFLSGTGFTTGKKHAYCPPYPSATTARLKKGISNQEFHKDRLCILMWVAERDSYIGQYYRIDIAKRNPGGSGYTWLDMKPGYNYNITLTSINGKGYNTKEEALNSPPGNLTYDIVVDEDNDNVIISTGQYALELEYERLISYSSVFNIHTLKVKAIIPEGSAMPSKNSITFNNFYEVNNIETITTKEQILKFTATNPIISTSNYDGSITFNLGTISKTVNIGIGAKILDAHAETLIYPGDYSKINWQPEDNGITCQTSSASIAISCKDNTRPIGWYNYNKSEPSTASDKEAEPQFETRMLIGYGKYSQQNLFTKFVFTQSVPSYIGWTGGSNLANTKRLVMENRDEEITTPPLYEWTVSKTLANTFIGSMYNDLTSGLNNTKYLMNLENNNNNPANYEAAYTCWKKNDKNNDGEITTDELEEPWYLPSHHQMIQIWAAYGSLTSPIYGGFYLSSTEYRAKALQNGSYNVHYLFIPQGTGAYTPKIGVKSYVRCVKDLK